MSLVNKLGTKEGCAIWEAGVMYQKNHPEEELKSCPFCGSNEIDIFFCEEECCGAKARSIDCECGVSMWVDTSEKEAIKLWNTRKEPPHE